ncbi:DUF6415 family natural product biosynthesis protein [Streptomyces sp. STCH 565 A]|uniref:DUF6415 family natural product biosynthesis protein n=1 Tax=Streptomyces sp. STCH 565 A TaxID=2950532 RepID=UPI00207597E5|nr:DUF6415 family natural product biosynthesis protein [Streptomyces sp. STCH 565 A]MCM8553995.1 DUF6415 family natural product biosynthesis protein [Streptomyces sp. STCH 565 A]
MSHITATVGGAMPSDAVARTDPVDADKISELISEALAANGILPPMSRLEALDTALRAEIERLVPLAQRQADATPLRSRDWYALIQAAERAEDAIQYRIGSAPLAGAIHVGTLAERVRELRAVLDGLR